jgi:hypothetical protein
MRVDDLNQWRIAGQAQAASIDSGSIGASVWNFGPGYDPALLEKLLRAPLRLRDVTDRIFQGLKTGADRVYIVREIERAEARAKLHSAQDGMQCWVEAELLHPLVKGGDSKRYHLATATRAIIFPYASGSDGSTKLLEPAELQENYPLAWQYLLRNRGVLQDREHGKMRGPHWYAYSRNQALNVIHTAKIFTPDIAVKPSFSLDESGHVFFTGGAAGGYGILVRAGFSRELVLGFLNSSVAGWFIRQTSTEMRGGYRSFEARFIRGIPLPDLDPSDAETKAIHERIVALVNDILGLKKLAGCCHVAHEIRALERQIDLADREIDRLVHGLYGLTEEEIQIVEGATGS